jgi:hypothetical protein
MRNYKQIQTTRTEKQCINKVCDMCGKEDKIHPWGNNWVGDYRIEETTIQYETGTHYPESRSTTIYSIDICPDCFKNKLIKWLNEQGVNIQETDNDY